MTPRTHKKHESVQGNWAMCYGVMLEFARGLEEELNHAEAMRMEAEEKRKETELKVESMEKECERYRRIADIGSCRGVMDRGDIRRRLDEIRGCVSDTEKAQHLLHSLLCQFLSSIADGDHRELSERAKLVLSGCDIVYGGGMTG